MVESVFQQPASNQPEEFVRAGKLPYHLLDDLLGKIGPLDPRVVVGPKVGEDAAVIDMGDRYLVAASDPVTMATDLLGWYAVHVNANDVACMGATPRWFLATMLLPPTSNETAAADIFNQVLNACQSLNVSLVGGHSEVTTRVDRPVIVGTMIGEVEKGKLVTTSGAIPGDSIVVTKGIALEGTALLARDQRQRLLESGVDAHDLDIARELLVTPGISVVNDALASCASGLVHSLHDPTEGGLATGLREMAIAAGVGLAIEAGSVPVLPQCQEVCRACGLDPLGLLASGALLIALPPEDVPAVLSALEAQGITGYEIGQITDPEEGIKVIDAHELADLPTFDRDELARFLDP